MFVAKAAIFFVGTNFVACDFLYFYRYVQFYFVWFDLLTALLLDIHVYYVLADIGCLLLMLHRVYDIMVKDIMKHRLFFVTYTSSYADLKSMLHKSDLRSFPIVDSPGRHSNALVRSISHDLVLYRFDDSIGICSETEFATVIVFPQKQVDGRARKSCSPSGFEYSG